MAEVLLIAPKDVAKFTALNGNVDVNKFVQFLKIAQDIHIQNYIGTDLLEKIQAEIVAGTLSGDYLELNNKYIKHSLIHWGMVQYLPFSAFTIANKGIYKHNSENSQTVDKNEVDFLIEKERDIAQHYTTRLVDYLCANNDKFPEYTSNTGNDVKPNKDTSFSGWSFT